MTRPGWTITLATCIMGMCAGSACVQHTPAVTPLEVSPPPATPPPLSSPAVTPAPANPAAGADSMRSTQLGVYTEAQARRGSQTYAESCGSCHTPSSHQGAMFTQNWDGHPLSDLYAYVSQQMPRDNPGSLDPNDAADVIAFLLKLYSMPAGTTELAPDSVAMKKILIDSRTTRPPQ